LGTNYLSFLANREKNNPDLLGDITGRNNFSVRKRNRVHRQAH